MLYVIVCWDMHAIVYALRNCVLGYARIVYALRNCAVGNMHWTVCFTSLCVGYARIVE